MFVPCGEKQLAYLKAKDKRLGAVIESLGVLKRPTFDDVFAAVVHHIIGQQISMKAQDAVWARLLEKVGTVDATHLLTLGREELQTVGTSFRKADYIMDFAEKAANGAFDITALETMSDAEVIAALSSLKDGGDAPDLHIQAPRRPELRRPRDTARLADALPAQGNRPPKVRTLPEALLPLRKHRQPLSLGDCRRRGRGADRSCGAEETSVVPTKFILKAT